MRRRGLSSRLLQLLAGAALITWLRRRSAAVSRPIALELDALAYAVAERTAERIEVAEQRALDRRTWVVLFAAATIAVLCVPLLVDRPSVAVELRAAGPRSIDAVQVADADGGGRFAAEAQLRGMLVATDASAARSRRTQQLELVLPVPHARCAALAAEIAGSCGRAAPRSTPEDLIDVHWKSHVLVDLAAVGVHSTALRTGLGDAPSSRTLHVDATRTTATFACIGNGGFTIATGSGRRIAVPARSCPEGPARQLLHVRFAFGGAAPTIAPSGTASLRLRAAGRTATLHSQDARLTVGETQSRVEDDRVALRSGRARGIRLAVDVSTAPARETAALSGQTVESVVPDREGERVPDEFTRHRDIWLGLIAAVLTLVVAVLLDRFTRLR
jgi:hypothetical protein